MTPNVRKLAIIVGINAYTSQPAATQLRGAVHDAKGYYRMLRRLGYRSEDMRVLTGPALTTAELYDDEARVQEATRQNILDAATWLTEQARDAVAAGQQVAVTVAMSGHGDFTAAAGFAILPSDYDGVEVGALSVATFGEALADVQQDITMSFFLDTCREAGAMRVPKGGSLRDYFDPETNLFVLAAREGQQSFERCIDGRWRGLFSWAVQRVLEQWDLRSAAHGAYMNISYAELTERAGTLLAQLNPIVDGVPVQQTVLLCAEENRGMAVANLVGQAGETSENPTAESGGHEWPADTNGDFKSRDDEPWGTLQVNSVGDACDYRFTTDNPWKEEDFVLEFVDEPSPIAAPLSFTTNSSQPQPVSGYTNPRGGEGRMMYRAASARIYLVVSPAENKLVWWCQRGALEDGYLPIPSSKRWIFEYTTDPGPMRADWYRVVDQPL